MNDQNGPALLGLVAVTVAAPAPVAVQDPDTVRELASSRTIYHRQGFVYPVADRRNPFVPLADRGGPRFEDLELVGILLGGSRPGMATLIDRATGRRYHLERGEAVGNARVLEIRGDAVVFRVTEFGLPRTGTLNVRKPSSPVTRPRE